MIYKAIKTIFLPLFLTVMAFASCGGRESATGGANDSVQFRYARLVHVYRYDGWALARIDNPWKPGEVLHNYIIVPKSGKLPANVPDGTVVRTPLERSVVFTSVHCGLLNALGKLDAVKGVCDYRYVLLPEVRKYVDNGGAQDMGLSMQPNVERIVAANPDALLVSPFSNSGGYGKLDGAGFPLVECADYMESSPLARAEWMRFFGILYGCEEKADSLFGVVERNYGELKGMAATTDARPALMCDLMMGGAWYVPGGESTIGQMFKDAGANYLFGDNKEKGSVSLSKEKVFAQAHDADFWIVRSGANVDLTYDGMRKDNEIYARFKPWKTHKVFACNTMKVPFFDEEPFRPDFMLRDLVMILHPELSEGYEPRYFRAIK